MTNTLVYNVDRAIITQLPPSLEWIVNYKFVVVLLVASGALLISQKRTILLLSLYVLFFPLIQLAKLLTITFLRGRWLMFLALLNFVVSFFSRLRERIVFVTLIALAITTSTIFQGSVLSLVAAALAGICLIYCIVSGFLGAFRPNLVLKAYGNIASTTVENRPNRFAFPNGQVVPYSALPPETQEKFVISLQEAVFHNHLMLFAADKLDEYRTSSWKIAPMALSVIYLYLLVGLLYSLAYYNLYQFDQSSFIVIGLGDYFDFFLLSFRALVFAGSDDIYPAARYMDLIHLSQNLVIAFVGVVFVTTLVTHRGEKFDRQLTRAIEDLEQVARRNEQYVTGEFNLKDMSDAIRSLQEAESKLLQVIKLISKSLSGRRRVQWPEEPNSREDGQKDHDLGTANPE